MSELTDLQICKRIAEIEGVECEVILNKLFVVNKRAMKYNPEKDALNHKLMLKHEIVLITVRANYGGPIIGYNAFYRQLVDKIYLEGLNPNKAILLAIIEANNG